MTLIVVESRKESVHRRSVLVRECDCLTALLPLPDDRFSESETLGKFRLGDPECRGTHCANLDAGPSCHRHCKPPLVAAD
ncbi:hypothetical protein [Nocardia sp. NPDC059195]|uniref:hypothetical protein n=1 Tax=Nocardia sp. NPDC059195 TaxID=3346765 RepID=UPI0036ADA901